MTPAIALPASAAAAASTAPAATALGTDIDGVVPFVAELAAAAQITPLSEPATAEVPVESVDESDADALSGLLNLLFAAPAPTPPPSAPARAATPDLALAAPPAAATTAASSPAVTLAADPVPAPAGEPMTLPTAPDIAFFTEAPTPLPLQTALPLPSASPAPSNLVLSTPLPPVLSWPPLALDQPQWSRELGERLVWSTERGLSQATIELHPQELGPIRVRIDTDGDTASIALHAAHAATRELLAVSLPQLRELLNAQGLQLGRSQVGANASAAPGREHEPRGDVEHGGLVPVRRRWRVGMVDQYV